MTTTVASPTTSNIALTTPTTHTRRTLLIMVTLLIIITVAQFQNIFRYPYYQDVEGTAIANAWSLTNLGKLTPYTYAYDDPPLGQIVMSAWINITGGINAFGFPLNSGRMLMLVLHVISAALVFGIARKLTNSDVAAILATLIFAFSPLSAAMQRKVLIENVELVLLLISIYFVTGPRRTLFAYVMSALFFGLTVLTKGTALFLAPGFLYIIRVEAHPHHKRFATALWIALTGLFIILYPMYAQMKQELFPQGWILGGDFPHVSLVQRMLDRGPSNGRFLNFGEGVGDAFTTWTDSSKPTADPVLIYGGIISFLYVIILSVDNIMLRPLPALGFAYIVYLCFGGQIFDTAVVPMLPLLAISIAIVINAAMKWVSSISPTGFFHFALTILTLGVLLYPFGMFYANRLALYTMDQVSGQLEALKWVKENVPVQSVVLTDNYAFVDLRQTFENSQHYWKVDTDPAVKFNILKDDVCNIDYVISTPQVFADTNNYKLELMKKVLDNSQLLKRYPNNGWPVEVRQVSKLDCAPKVAEAK